MTSFPLPARRVLIAGATGLVGSQILQALLADSSVTEIHVLSRRDIAMNLPRVTTHIVDFAQLPATLPAVDEVFLALGTTLRAAGNRAAFRAVDFSANLAVAKAAVAAGATRVAMVSAVGASTQSSAFYSRTKGELEDALSALNLTALVIARPSLLVGNRHDLNQPFRFWERVALTIARPLAAVLPRNYRPVRAKDVALSLVNTLNNANGKVIWHYRELSMAGRAAR
ncbi:NAD-dependent epimerase/dehydratase family protein [Musicola paradisiaca]|uniref:NAD-dependent epimerase/dehydratase n=1 Tax=Musicola paradisiaca (strain Ech703) TaxID=579405 RepID=C6CD14_MUSP7|nr:NAD-dependent epimerase/dehydratase family protein [Musicola paradisiaca]ACS85055.1 NAD-dependent epimerase/dehydratase [Musicola paradisiaca Ech703]